MPEINDEYNLLSREKTIYCVSNVTSPIQYFIEYINQYIVTWGAFLAVTDNNK